LKICWLLGNYLTNKKITAIAKKQRYYRKVEERIFIWRANCKILFTEELSHGMKIAGVEIINSFL